MWKTGKIPNDQENTPTYPVFIVNFNLTNVELLIHAYDNLKVSDAAQIKVYLNDKYLNIEGATFLD